MRTGTSRVFVSSTALWIALCGVASAATVGIETVPTGWRLQNYLGEGLALWGAPAPECLITSNNNTKLNLPSTATANDINQFWATMTAAIVGQHTVFLYYDNTTCIISSFGMDGDGT